MEEFKPDVPKSEKPYNKYEGEALYSGAPLDQEPTDPQSLDQKDGHGYRGSLETAQESAGKHSVLDVLRKKKVSIPIIGTVAAAAAIAVGISRMNSGKDSSKLGNQPVAAASATPTAATSAVPTSSATPETTPSATATPEKAPTQQEVDAYASWAEKYAEMGVDEFEALPRDERLAYAQYLMDYTVSRNVYNATYNSKYSNNGDYKITPTVASPEDTGEKIFLNLEYHKQLSILQLEEKANSPTLDKVKAQDALSAVYYDVGNKIVSNAYKDDVKWIDNPSQIRPAVQNPHTNDILHTSKLLTGHDSQGNEAQYKIVTVRYNSDDPNDPSAGKKQYAEVVYDTFPDYNGSQRSTWLLVMYEGSMDKLKANSTIK